MSKYYTSRTLSNGVTYTTEHDTDNEDPVMVGCLLLLGLIFLIVVFVGQWVWAKTGFNFLEADSWRSLFQS